MRIDYLSSSFLISPQANAVHVMRMCHAFAALGHHVNLYALTGRGTDDDVFDYYGAEKNFNLIRHNESENRVVSGILALRRHTPFIRIGGFPSLLYGRSAIAPALRRHPPDLVYARNLNWLACIQRHIPFVAESHRPPRNRMEHAIEGRLYRRPGFRRLVVISEKLRSLYLTEFPWLGERILVAHDAADDPFPSTHSPTVENRRGFHVGYIGHLYAGRGAGLIKAIADRLPEMTFHLVGGTDEDCTRLKESGLPENIVLHGHHPPVRLPGFYSQFDVVLAPYQRTVSVGDERSDTSAFMSPLKIFEYMAWAKPILCTDLPVLREVLENKKNAILLPPEDVSAWVDALQRLHGNPAERNRLGQAARADFLAFHSWDRRARTVLSDLSLVQ